MSRPSLKKIFLYTCFSLSAILILICVQNGLHLSKNKSSSNSNANTRKLAENEHYINVRAVVNETTSQPILIEYYTASTTTETSDLGIKIPEVSDRPWYMKTGVLRPNRELKISQALFPEDLPNNDRIPEQLMYLPPEGVVPENTQESEVPLKKILLWNGASSWGALKPGRGVFLKEKCPVSSCALSSSRSEAETADLVIFKDHFTMPTFKRPLHQKWMLYLLECPLHTQMFKYPNVFNWTATYRRDSTLVAPYERWQYYDENIRRKIQEKNYSRNKTKQVAWFVSNCGARNGRLNYARELGKYINVDIFGACGPNRCPRTNANKCFQLLDKDYKFYLAFENSNCKDYITEKFFVNGLGHDVLPIAMGARLEDYEEAAPHKSFLHVDQFSGPEQLAKYLHKLDQNDNLYNEYFKWKGTGEFINTKFWCRVCSVLHSNKTQPDSAKWYTDINEWWRGDGICANSGWKPSGVNLIEEDKEETGESLVGQDVSHHTGDDQHLDPLSFRDNSDWSYDEPKSSNERSKILMGS